MRGGLLVAATVVLATGCGAGEYAYQPTVPSRARVEALHSPSARADVIYAARYRVPETAPRGGVRLASFGVAIIQAPSGCASSTTAEATRALHARLTVRNRADESPWSLDTRAILLAVPGHPDLRPSFANTDAGTLPVVTIGRAQQRTIDVYFPLPAPGGRAPSFEVAWRIQTGAGPVAGRTPFRREPLYNQRARLSGEVDGPEPFWDTYQGSFAPGQGPTWWFEPEWHGAACARASGAASPGFWPRVMLSVNPR
jgi:hypothetical protein